MKDKDLSPLTRDALIKAALRLKNAKPVYEPIIVSPSQYADPEFMTALKRNYPRGRLVWR